MEAIKSPDSARPARLLDYFRATRQRPKLHPREVQLLWIISLHLCFLPWALGGMRPWSCWFSLGFALVGFIFALVPRTYPSGHRDESIITLTAWPRLRQFPLFWIGLLVLSYIVLQGCNPSWHYAQNDTRWWLVRSPEVAWLPTSTATPFERFNLWRQFIIYTSAWLTLCTIWTGLVRRYSLKILLTVLVLNGLVLMVAGGIQRLFFNYAILGFIPRPAGTDGFATLIYHNHAGAYFALLAGIAATLAVWTQDHGERTFRKSTPAPIFALLAFCFSLTVLSTHSRGASLLLVIAFFLFILWLLLRRLAPNAPAGSSPAVTWALVVVLCLGFIFIASEVNFSRLSVGLDRLFAEQIEEESVRSRLLAFTSGEHMLSDHWLRGLGAGSFRYHFPTYIKEHPAVYADGKLFWEHVHRDWLELPIELGLVGVSLILSGAAYGLRLMILHRRRWDSAVLPLFLACSQTLAHAWFDFPYQNPAILITWLAVVTTGFRWLQLDRTISPASKTSL